MKISDGTISVALGTLAACWMYPQYARVIGVGGLIMTGVGAIASALQETQEKTVSTRERGTDPKDAQIASLTRKLAEREAEIETRKRIMLGAVEHTRGLEERLTKAEGDTKRLDWLIAGGGHFFVRECKNGAAVVWDQSNGLTIAGRGKTARDAIDEAMKP